MIYNSSKIVFLFWNAKKNIQKQLSQRKGEIVPLTAETGGLNFMIIDASALTEHSSPDHLSYAVEHDGHI